MTAVFALVGVERSTIRSLTRGSRKHDVDGIVYATEGDKELLVKHTPVPVLWNRYVLRLLWQTGTRMYELAGFEIGIIDPDERRTRVSSEKSHNWRPVFYQPIPRSAAHAAA